MESHLEKKTIKFTSGYDMNFIFNPQHSYIFDFSDFDNSKLSGELKDTQSTRNKNFLSSNLSDLTFTALDFSSSDFLDSFLNNCTFSKCTMKGSHFNACNVVNSLFDDCLLEWTNYNKTSFRNCVFKNCQFENILIKNCEFISCNFLGGTTTNKLFENCTLLECQFKNIEIQTQTILENFGLANNNFENVTFRDARRRDEHEIFKVDEITADVAQPKSKLEEFALSFYNSSMSLPSYKIIFDITNDIDWLDFKASSTLISRTENFVSFITYLYDNNLIILLPIIRLKDFFNELVKRLELFENQSIEQTTIVRSFQGLRLSLSRYVDEFLSKLMEFENLIVNNEVRLIAEGPIDKKYYENLLSHLVDDNIIKIVNVTKRNSPNDVLLYLGNAGSFWFLAATFLATRLKYEFNFNPPKTKKGSKKKIGKAITKKKKLTHFEIKLGPLHNTDKEIGIKFLSVFSDGISHSFLLGFSPKRAIELHKRLLGFEKILH